MTELGWGNWAKTIKVKKSVNLPTVVQNTCNRGKQRLPSFPPQSGRHLLLLVTKRGFGNSIHSFIFLAVQRPFSRSAAGRGRGQRPASSGQSLSSWRPPRRLPRRGPASGRKAWMPRVPRLPRAPFPWESVESAGRERRGDIALYQYVCKTTSWECKKPLTIFEMFFKVKVSPLPVFYCDI